MCDSGLSPEPKSGIMYVEGGHDKNKCDRKLVFVESV